MKNIETKIKVADFRRIKTILKKLSVVKNIGKLVQVDTYGKCHHGRLKIREINNRDFELISYQRPNIQQSKTSDYQIIPLTGAQTKTLKRIFKNIFRCTTVKKTRDLWIFRHTRIHLDQIEKLGNFIELETVIKNIPPAMAFKEHKQLLQLLQMEQSRFIKKSYCELLNNK